MNEFRNLLKLLQRELAHQEELLRLLTKERVAIVKLNQSELDDLKGEKTKILSEVQSIETARTKVIKSILAPHGEVPQKLTEVLRHCPDKGERAQLERVGIDLRQVATQSKELNDENTMLIRQALGLIASTIAIMRSLPESDLPSYNATGLLSSGADELAFKPSRQLSREA